MFIKLSTFSSANIIIWFLLFMLLVPTVNSLIYDSLFLCEWTILPRVSPLHITLIADKTGLVFSCVVLFISANVLSFSKLYIADDLFKNRFTVLVLLFILSINLLIYIPHLIALLLGWDGLGLVSFILVMYYQNPSSLAASMITALTNRIGDVIILLAITLTLSQGHWLIINMWANNFLLFQTLFITVAAITKSAQMPFSSWLPAAIAAPTPVSALVHSSTLVTAGVFLLIRFYPFLHQFPLFNHVIIFIATCTTLMAGLRANTECDFKKIVALSTLSQLGVIIFRIGLGLPWVAFFHIITHALFKALLFICVGSFIHFHIHRQDLRWMGNISHQIPVIVSCLIISNLALCGFPFLAGFYSKDIIIEFAIQSTIREIILQLSLFRLGLTSFYSTRALLVGVCAPKLIMPFISVSEPTNIKSAAISLSVMATVSGAILSWFYPIFTNISTVSQPFKLMPLLLLVLGFCVGWLYSTSNIKSQSILSISQLSHTASTTIWFLVPLSTQFMFKYPIFVSHNALKNIDQGILEFFPYWLMIISAKPSWYWYRYDVLPHSPYGILGFSVFLWLHVIIAYWVITLPW